MKQIIGILSQKKVEEVRGEAVMVLPEERIAWLEQSFDSRLHRLTKKQKGKRITNEGATQRDKRKISVQRQEN